MKIFGLKGLLENLQKKGVENFPSLSYRHLKGRLMEICTKIITKSPWVLLNDILPIKRVLCTSHVKLDIL